MKSSYQPGNGYKLTIVALLAAMYAGHANAASTLENVNNQAIINIGYLPTQINNSPSELNSQYLKGHELGLGMSITKLFHQRIYAQAALNATAGNLSFGKQTERTTATTIVQNGGLRLGYIFLPHERVGLTPYATLGYQYWQYDEGGRYDNGFIKNGYSKFYQNGFYGLGLLSQVVLAPRWVMSADVTFGKTINPWLRYDAPEVPNSQVGKNVIYQSAFLASQPFYQADVGVDYAVNDGVHANAGVQYYHTQFSSAVTNQSNIVQPHLSIAQWNYHAGLGLSLDPDIKNALHGSDTISDAIKRANNQASLWFGYIFQNYAETTPGVDYYFDREVKSIPAVNLQATKSIHHIYSQFNLLFAGGNTAYKSNDGTNNFSGSPPSNSYTRNTLLITGLRLGYTLFPNDQLGLTPYVAGGYRRWLRDLTGSGDSGYLLGGYVETYQFAWYSIGLLAQYAPYTNWVLNVDGNAGSMEDVTHKSWTSFDAPATYQKILTLKQRFIYNLGVGSDYRFARDWHALVQLNYLYFTFGRSANSALPHGGYWYEPNSTTRQFSIMLGLGYEFA